jgi:hypothetical protein
MNILCELIPLGGIPDPLGGIPDYVNITRMHIYTYIHTDIRNEKGSGSGSFFITRTCNEL